jgi:hypothetical protein
MLLLLPAMVVSTLAVMLFVSLSEGISGLGSFLSLGADTLLHDGSFDEGNIDLTRRLTGQHANNLNGRPKLPAPQFTSYGSPTAPSYSSYSYTGPPSPTGLASLGHRREEEVERKPLQQEQQVEEEEGSLLSWLAVPGVVLLGLLLLPSSIPGSGLVTRLALDALALQGEPRRLPSPSLPALLEAVGELERAEEPVEAREQPPALALFSLLVLGLLLAPASLPGEAWSPLSNLAWRLSAGLTNSLQLEARGGGDPLASIAGNIMESVRAREEQ